MATCRSCRAESGEAAFCVSCGSVMEQPPAQVEQRPQRDRKALLLVGGVALLAVVGGGLGWMLAGQSGGLPAQAGAPSAAAIPTAPPKAPTPVVTVTAVVTPQPRPTVTVTASPPSPASVAPTTNEGVIRAYLAAVNEHQFALACSYGTSEFSPCSGSNFSAFVEGTDTTTLSNIQFGRNDGASYYVSYTSNQSAEDSPDRSGHTCTTWSIRYDMEQTRSGPRIRKAGNPYYPGRAWEPC